MSSYALYFQVTAQSHADLNGVYGAAYRDWAIHCFEQLHRDALRSTTGRLAKQTHRTTLVVIPGDRTFGDLSVAGLERISPARLQALAAEGGALIYVNGIPQWQDPVPVEEAQR